MKTERVEEIARKSALLHFAVAGLADPARVQPPPRRDYLAVVELAKEVRDGVNEIRRETTIAANGGAPALTHAV